MSFLEYFWNSSADILSVTLVEVFFLNSYAMEKTCEVSASASKPNTIGLLYLLGNLQHNMNITAV